MTNYIAGNDTISVIHVTDDTNKQNISLGFQPGVILGDPSSNKVYVTNPGSNTVSIIDGSNHTGVLDKKETQNIIVGQHPSTLAINPRTNIIYAGNRGSHTVSVINGFSSKVTAGVTFNVKPGNSGTILRGSQEYPTNVYIYLDNGTSCTGQPRNNFQFDHWVETLPSRNSTIPVGDASGNLIVNRYG
jgi:YVTN family beta-propeller protein